MQGLVLGSDAGDHEWCCPPLKTLGVGFWVILGKATFPDWIELIEVSAWQQCTAQTHTMLLLSEQSRLHGSAAPEQGHAQPVAAAFVSTWPYLALPEQHLPASVGSSWRPPGSAR